MSSRRIHPPGRDAEVARWFVNQVQPHDGLLKAYLTGSFPAVRDIEDVIQESYLRLWKARASGPVRYAKAFLFRVARNVALDVVRRSRASPITAMGDLKSLSVAEEEPCIPEALSAHERINKLFRAIATLPPRGRELVILCHIGSVSRREAAARLGISQRTVDEHLYRAMKRLGKPFRHEN